MKIRVDTLKIIGYSFKDLRNGKTKILSEFNLQALCYFFPTIMNAGNELVSISKENSILMAKGTKEILEHFGTVLKDLGTKVDNSMIQLNY